MRKTLFLLLLIVSLSLASTFTEGEFAVGTEEAGLEILRSWQLLAIMALMISSILVAIAYMIGMGFEMPEIKAWAGTELTQIIANAIIILVLMITIVFLDSLVSAIVSGSGLTIVECTTPGQSCLQAVSNAYLADYIDAAKDGARSTLINNVDASANANRRMGLYCLTIYCLQFGFTTTIAGHYVLDTDMYAIIFESYTHLLMSLEAQKFFVSEISFGMGPLILAAGIVARSFFFTRKLGGLLIAIAAGIMFFFPMMYVFDWLTLDLALTGDRALDVDESDCPRECSIAPPLAYIEGGEALVSVSDVYAAFSLPDDSDQAVALLNGTSETEVGSNGSATNKVVTSCYYGSREDCPTVCRELPYPHTIPQCVITENQTACAALESECKAIRLVNTSSEDFNATEYNRCPAYCRVVPPLQSDCRVDDCIGSRFDCRVYQRTRDGPNWWPRPVNVGNYERCNEARDCPVSPDAQDSCSYIIPETGLCDDLCAGCPPHCRVSDATASDVDSDCKDESNNILPQCLSCSPGCMVNRSNIVAISPTEGDSCSDCPIEKRLRYSPLPVNYTSGGCLKDNCPDEFRLDVPRTACEQCLLIEEAYSYDPPVYTTCSDLCAPSDNVPVKDPGSYMKIGGDGLVGREEIKGVSKLMIPAYLLPLFNIVATLVFIKGLSTILGGDIEIPGISKVF